MMFISCLREDGPEKVTSKFVNHFAASEYLEAAEYGTESTVQLMNMMADWASVGFYLPEEEIHTITHKQVSCIINGDNAICTYLVFNEPNELNLVKIDGKWLVDIRYDEFDDEKWYENEEDADWNYDGSEQKLK